MSTAEKMEKEGIPLAEAKSSFFDLVAKVESQGEEVVLTRRGKPVAKLVPIGEPQRKKVEFGFLKGNITYAPDEDFSSGDEAWGALHDLKGESYGRP